MIDIRQTTLVEADFTEPFDDRVDILYRELELATKWQCPSLLMAIYSSEFVHGDAELALENRLLGLGQKAHHIVVKSQEDANIPLLISELANLKDVVVFVDGLGWGCGQADYNAYRCLDKHREFFIENRVRVVFWLTEMEAIHLAHYAPDYWTFRHRVIEFVDAPRPEQLQPQWVETSCPIIPDDLAGPAEDLDAKITLRAALLTDLPEGAESTSSRANLLLTLGILHWRRGDFDQSAQFLNTALELAAKLQDNRFEALCFNAIALVNTAQGKTEAAIQAYTRAVELAPEQITPWNNLGNLYSRLGQADQALAAYKKAVETNPADMVSWLGLGDAHFKLGRHEEAVFAYKKNLEMDPGNAHAWISLGDVYAAEGQWDDALATYQKGIEIEPANARVWNELGTLHYNAAAHDEAAQAYSKAIELGLESHQSYGNMADIYFQKGNYQEAIPLLQKAVELQPEPSLAAPIWNRLGEAYRKLNDYDHAIEAYRKADELAAETAPTQALAAAEPVAETVAEPNHETAAEPVPANESAEPIAESVPAFESAEAIAESVPVVESAEPIAESVPAAEVVLASETLTFTLESDEKTEEGLAFYEPAAQSVLAAEEASASETVHPFAAAEETPGLTESVAQSVSAVHEALASEPVAPSTEDPPLLTGLIDDSASMQSESDHDFAKWLESLASRLPAVETPENAAPIDPPAREVEPAQASDDSSGELSMTLDDFDLYSPRGLNLEVETPALISQNPTPSPSTLPAEQAPDVTVSPDDAVSPLPSSSPDVSFRLEALRASLASMKPSSLYTVSPEETDFQEIPSSPDGECSPTSASAETPIPAETLPASPAIGSQPSTAGLTAALGASSTQAGTDARSAQIWNELGNIYYNIVAYDEAINALNKAIELDHSYGWTYNNLASIYIHKGSYAEAIPLLQKGIPLLNESKDKALLWNRLGDAYRRLDQPEKAAEAYKKAVELDPDNVSLLTRARFSLLGNCRA